MKTFCTYLLVLVCCVWVMPTRGQSFSGTFTMSASTGTFTLTLKQGPGKRLTGTLVGSTGLKVSLEGELDDGVGMGVARYEQGGIFFETFYEGDDLILMLIEPDSNNMPDYNRTRQLTFQRATSSVDPPAGAVKNPLGKTKPALLNPLARKSAVDPIAGTYSGDGLQLTLNGSSGRYSGALVFQGTRYDVSATGTSGTLTGTFGADGGMFPFTAKIKGTRMSFSTGGTSYSLNRSGSSNAPPAVTQRSNPLQKSATAIASGQTLSDEQSGISLRVPPGWKAKQVSSGYVLGSDTHPGLIMISGHTYGTLQELQADSGEGIQDAENGISLTPSSQLVRVGANGLGSELTGTVNGTPAKGYAIGMVSPYGGGIVVVALTSTEAYTSQHQKFAEQIAASTRFTKPKVDTALMQWFAGKYWRYTSSSSYSGSFSRESSMTFCANGTYSDSYEAGASGSSADQYGNQAMNYGAVGTQQGRARWVIRGNKQRGLIIVTYPNGKSQEIEYVAVGEGQDMRFNGKRYGYVNRGDCP